MKRWQQLLLVSCSCALCGLGGAWLGHRKAESEHEHAFRFINYCETEDLIKTLDSLYQNDQRKAAERLERWLSREALVFGPIDDRPKSIDPESKSILKLIANHRETHPFVDPYHPGTNSMVEKALKAAK
jgi:hypothetical protein